jgi:hypothetical protein
MTHRCSQWRQRYEKKSQTTVSLGEENNMWNQIYNPLGNAALSTITAAVPVIALLL